LFVAINPIWGFSWYFNTESWASAFYQKVTALRVDKWRASMVDAVTGAYGGNSDELFRVAPAGIEGQDFSFIVIGDPGEDDASQYSLVERYLELGRLDRIKFLVIASDVIYPAGEMVDYERNFYLPFKGFTKPIYATNANFLEPKAARAVAGRGFRSRAMGWADGRGSRACANGGAPGCRQRRPRSAHPGAPGPRGRSSRNRHSLKRGPCTVK